MLFLREAEIDDTGVGMSGTLKKAKVTFFS